MHFSPFEKIVSLSCQFALKNLAKEQSKGVEIDFSSASVADLPPWLRAIFEDNRMMKEKLRKYKHKTQDMEAELLKRNNQIVSLEDTIGLLKQQLQVRFND